MRYLSVNRSLELQNVRKRQAEARLRTDFCGKNPQKKKSADTDSHIHPDMHTHKHKHTVLKDDPENRQSF